MKCGFSKARKSCKSWPGGTDIRRMRIGGHAKLRPGMREYEVEAELLHEFRRHGAQAPAYTPIVAGGANACILHYVENKAGSSQGPLLIDAGCELSGYAQISRVRFRSTENSAPRKRILRAGVVCASGGDSRSKAGKFLGCPHIGGGCGCWCKVSLNSACAAAAWKRYGNGGLQAISICTAPVIGWSGRS